MRKTACTFSIFIVIVAVIVAGFVIQIPDVIWWWHHHPERTVSLWIWLSGNVSLPCMLIFFLGFAVYTAWKAAGEMCGALQRWWAD